MILDSIKKLNKERIERFYGVDHSGIIIIHDKLLAKKILAEFKQIKHKPFNLKDHQGINNGQTAYSAKNVVFLKTYKNLRRYFPNAEMETVLDSSFTRYPISHQGAEFHRDFSHNMICTTTFFSGYSEIQIADDKLGKNKIILPIRPGDILIMRAPRDSSIYEKSLRPLHAMGMVLGIMYTYEIREVVH